MENLKIGIVLSTIRENRKSEEIANWILERAKENSTNSYEIVDLRDYNLPILGMEDTTGGVNKFIDKTAELDGFIFVLAEYNHSVPGVLKNALDYLGPTMHSKAAGIVSYGAVGGARAAEHLRGILGQLDVATISNHVALSIFLDYDKDGNFKPLAIHEPNLKTILEKVEGWSKALKTFR